MRPSVSAKKVSRFSAEYCFDVIKGLTTSNYSHLCAAGFAHRQEKVGGHVQIATVDVADDDHSVACRDIFQHIPGDRRQGQEAAVVSTGAA